MGTVTKGKAQRQDLDVYDGSLAASRTNSSGGTTTGLKIGNEVDVLQIYGSGDTSNATLATINKAVGAQGSANVSLLLAPTTWTIDDDITLASNFTLVVPAGCVLNVSSGKTFTIAGLLVRYHATYTSGDGTVTVSGTDIIPTTDYGRGYAADTGGADVYVIAPSPAITAYAAGQKFSFKASAQNTGASTLNVSSLGAKSIYKDVTTELAASDIAANEVVTVVYDGSAFQLIPTVGMIESSTTGDIESGTLMLFQQTAAPTGWTKQSTHNDKAIRVVTGTASSGGSVAFSTVFGLTATDAHTLTAAQSGTTAHQHSTPAHQHGIYWWWQDADNEVTVYDWLSTYGPDGSTSVGTGNRLTTTASNTMPSGGSGTSGASTAASASSGHSHNIDLQAQYVDVTICSKD